LQIFRRFGQSKRIEASVTGHGAVQPRGRFRVRVPEVAFARWRGEFLRRWLLRRRRLLDWCLEIFNLERKEGEKVSFLSKISGVKRYQKDAMKPSSSKSSSSRAEETSINANIANAI
jgi:hypothetical protein